MKIAVVCVLVFAFLAISEAMPIEDIENNVAQIETELVNTFCGPTTNDQTAETAAQKSSGTEAKGKGKKGKGGKGKGKGKSTTPAPE